MSNITSLIFESEQVVYACTKCGKPILIVLPGEDSPYRKMFESLARSTAVHNECADRIRAERRSANILAVTKENLARWHTICPNEFQKPLNVKEKGYNDARLKKILSWQFGPIGLRVIGPSGKCKTRFMFQLLEREFNAGRKVGAWAHGDLRAQISALASGDSAAVVAFLTELVRLDILLIDDLGKGRCTPAAEEHIYTLIAGRARENRPTHYTANVTIEEFSLQLSSEYREPTTRRIVETTTELLVK